MSSFGVKSNSAQSNMHARHRSPGNGYRSSSTTGMGMGMGMALSSSRISPDPAQSLRSHALYSSSDSHYRNFNRGGFGRPHPHNKSFQPPQQPPPPPPPPPPPLPRKADVFMEAGRLAAEYLVSQGLLPSTLLSSKWHSASSKKYQQQQVGELFPEFSTRQQQEMDNALQLPQEGRTSALARLGNVVPDAASGRRRFAFDDSGSLRTHLKGRRRAGTHRQPPYSSDWGREYSRSASSLDRHHTVSSPDTEVDDDTSSGQREVGKDVGNGVQKPRSNDLPSKIEDAAGSESELEKLQFLDDRNPRPCSSAWVDSSHETEEEPGKISDDIGDLDLGTEQVKDCAGVHETEKQNVTEDLSAVETASPGICATDLLTLCRFAKVPTRTRSSLASKIPKVDPPPTTAVENDSHMLPCSVPVSGSGVLVALDSLDGSSSDALLDKTNDSEHLNSEVFKAQAVKSAENVRELTSAYNLEQSHCVRSLSFADRGFACHTDRESSQVQMGFGSCSPMVNDRREKRALEDKDMQEGAKKLRECLPSMVVGADEGFHRSKLNEKEFSAREDGASSGEKAIMAVCCDGLEVSDSQLQKEGDEHCAKYAEEKQLFPSSFKICDLNLMEVSDAHENHDGDPIIIYPALSEIKREAAQVDVDLSISNSNVSGENSRCPVDGKEIEVIDLENDSAQEDKNLSIAERK